MKRWTLGDAARGTRAASVGPGDKDLGKRASGIVSQVGPSFDGFCWVVLGCGAYVESAPSSGSLVFPKVVGPTNTQLLVGEKAKRKKKKKK